MMKLNLLALAHVDELIEGDVFTFTHSTSYFVILMIVGAVFTFGSGAVLWAISFTWRKKGYLAYVFFLVGIVLLLSPVLMGGHSVVVTPSQIEVNLGRRQVIPFADVQWIKTREQRGYRGRITTYFDFGLTDGTTKQFTGDLMKAAVARIEQLASQGKLRALGAPGRAEAARAVPDGGAPAQPAAPPAAVAAAPPGPAAPNDANGAPPGNDAPRNAPASQSAESRGAELAERAARVHADVVRRAQERVAQQGLPGQLADGLPPAAPQAGDTDAAAPVLPQTGASASSSQRPPPQRKPTPTAAQVTPSTTLAAGMRVQAEWGSQYYQADVVEVMRDGTVTIHYVGWADAFDETLPRARLWIEPTEIAGRSAVAATEAPAADPDSPIDPVRELRVWTDSTGKHKVEAQLLGFADGQVRLKRQDGKEVAMPIERLSTADQQFVRALAGRDSDSSAAQP